MPETRTASWTLDVGAETWATPLVVGTTVFLGSDDGFFRAIDADSGTVLWQFPAGGAIRGGAATDGEALYFTSEDGVLHRLELDGTEAWAIQTGEPTPPGARDDWDNYGSRPAVADGVVYAGGFDGTASAVDAATGAILWTFDAMGPIEADIAVADGIVHVPSMFGIHWALDAETGEQVWASPLGGDETTSPLVVDGSVIVGSRAATLRALDAETGQQEWNVSFTGSWVQSGAVVIGPDVVAIGSSDLRAVQAVRISDGSEVWFTPVDGAPWAVPAVADGVVYATEISIEPWFPWEASLCALDSHTGGILWAADIGDPLTWSPDGLGAHGIGAAPAVVGEYVVVAGLDGVVYAFER
jgi:outer membrane protein assembly factor BamB